MENRQDESQRPQASSSVTTTTQGPVTTTTHGPITTSVTTSTAPGGGTNVIHYGPQSTTVTAPTITTTQTLRSPAAQRQLLPNQNPQRLRSGSIRIRRPSVQAVPVATPQPTQTSPEPPKAIEDDSWQGNRRRSSSEPRPPPAALFPDDETLRRQQTATPTPRPLQPLYEEDSRGGILPHDSQPVTRVPSVRRNPLTRQISAINIIKRKKSTVGRDSRQGSQSSSQPEDLTMQPNVVDVLDVIDPEVSALTTLNNVQNSLFLPNLPWLYNRQPTYDLGQSTSESSDEEAGLSAEEDRRLQQITQEGEAEQAGRSDGLRRTNTIDSILSTMDEGPEHHYAVLPHGASLTGWTDEEKAALDDHVRHLLHSRRAKFKRTMRGFGRYVRNPLGFLVTLYFFLITFWGAAWVLFLIGWIYVGDRQDYFVEIADQILTALFCVVGITMFPFRLYDTYHMAFVAKYAYKTWRVRSERGLQELKDHNELPNRPASAAWETGNEHTEEQMNRELPVLSSDEQTSLEKHQAKLAKSHTFYRPHETYTHHAFSIKLLITIVVLLDCHSMLQCALGGTTWGIYYKNRPKELTAIILSFSLTCNITAGILIGVGDKRSRKKLVVEQILRQEMTEEALKKLRKERGLKAKGLKTKKEKKQIQKEMGEEPKNPLDTILHRG